MIVKEDREGVAILRIGRGKANALDLQLLEQLGGQINGLPTETRALVLTGNGTMFSAGIDLPKMLEAGSDYTYRLIDALDSLLESFIDLSIPSVAALEGHAIAGGFILAAACDVRLMADGEGKLGLTELLLGVPLPSLALEVVRSAVGDRCARRMALHGELFSAAEGVKLGLVDELVTPDALLDHAVDSARRLGAVPRSTFELTKRQLMSPLRQRMASLGEGHDQAARQTWVTDETREVIERFVRARLG